MEGITINDMYILVLWPDSQKYMERDWFESEAVLCNPDCEHRLGEESSAYFIPIKYIDERIEIKWNKGK